MLDAGKLDDLQPAQDRNVDVHNDDIRDQCVDLRQRLHAIGSLARNGAAMRIPVKQAFESLPDHDLIIHEQDLQVFHAGSPFSVSQGSRTCAVTPPVSFSV